MSSQIRTAAALILWSSLLPLTAQAQPARESVAGWYRALGAPTPGESFGRFVTRAARLQHGAPYAVTAPPPGAEEIRVDVSRFECVSFIESALAIAR